MNSTFHPSLVLAGRVLMCIIFLLSGFMKFANWNAMVGMMQQQGITQGTGFLLGAAALVEIVGGLGILFGYQTRAASILLASTWCR